MGKVAERFSLWLKKYDNASRKEPATAGWEGRKGGWAIDQSMILITTITLQGLKKRGYQSLLDMYFKLNPSVCEPPYLPEYLVRRVRDPYPEVFREWCERRSPSASAGGAVYSISGLLFYVLLSNSFFFHMVSTILIISGGSLFSLLVCHCLSASIFLLASFTALRA